MTVASEEQGTDHLNKFRDEILHDLYKPSDMLSEPAAAE
jgi:hypothetical protein